MTDNGEKIYIILTMSGTKFSRFLRFMSGENRSLHMYHRVYQKNLM